MKVQINKIKQSDDTNLIIVEFNDELFATSRNCDDCITLTEDFCKEWLNQGEPEEIELTPYMGSYFWSVSEQIIEVVQSDESSLQTDEEKGAFSLEIDSLMDENQLPSLPNEIITYTDMYGNIYNSLKECEAGEKKIFMKTIKSEGVSKKHNLVKKANLPKKVDFEMLVNSPYSIWNGGYEKGETQSINETVQQGELAAQNLELFLSLMKNPKFATKASFEIEKILKKTKTI